VHRGYPEGIKKVFEVKRAPLVLVTAGPTRERIDPVRFVSNYSTGTFGYAIAKEARDRGCKVILISGPVSIKPPAGVKLINVESAIDMLHAVKTCAAKADYIFMSAAVSDWRVRRVSKCKIKRGNKLKTRTLELTENPDILRSIKKPKGCVLTGFALETEGLNKNAMLKLMAKRMDMIVANKLTKQNRLFGDSPLDIIIIDTYNNKYIYKNMDKKRLAKIILDKAFGFNIK
jgi:phosphopantothenoylcysteine decarboxylase/phosphopantothenate--cysteine ligase